MTPQELKTLMRSEGISCEEKTLTSFTHAPLACSFSISAGELMRLADAIEAHGKAELRRSIGILVIHADDSERRAQASAKLVNELGAKLIALSGGK